MINIAACTDSRFVMPTGVMIQSVCMNNPNVDIVFHIIVSDDFTLRNKLELDDVASNFKKVHLLFYSASDSIRNFSFPGLEGVYTITSVSYYRLWLAEILPSDIDKILYLDGDVIVRHSLQSFFDIDLSDYAVGAVYDGWEDNTVYNRLKYSSNLGYFNAGVLLINLAYWREYAVINDFISYMRNHSEDIKWCDQDVLNACFSDKKKFLPLKYNFQNGFLWKNPNIDFTSLGKEILENYKDPIIIHFTGEKPWSKYQRRPNPFSSSWIKYQNYTKWKGVTTDYRPFKIRIINMCADFLRRIHLKKTDHRMDYLDINPLD